MAIPPKALAPHRLKRELRAQPDDTLLHRPPGGRFAVVARFHGLPVKRAHARHNQAAAAGEFVVGKLARHPRLPAKKPPVPANQRRLVEPRDQALEKARAQHERSAFRHRHDGQFREEVVGVGKHHPTLAVAAAVAQFDEARQPAQQTRQRRAPGEHKPTALGEPGIGRLQKLFPHPQDLAGPHRVFRRHAARSDRRHRRAGRWQLNRLGLPRDPRSPEIITKNRPHQTAEEIQKKHRDDRPIRLGPGAAQVVLDGVVVFFQRALFFLHLRQTLGELRARLIGRDHFPLQLHHPRLRLGLEGGHARDLVVVHLLFLRVSKHAFDRAGLQLAQRRQHAVRLQHALPLRLHRLGRRGVLLFLLLQF